MNEAEVLVVGGGPAGMTLAGDLARAGRRVSVLERWEQVNPASRAFATMPRTLELLDARGLAEGLLDGAARTGSVRLFGDAELHLDHVDSAFPFAMIRPQADVDTALAAYAERQGAEIRRGVEVVGLTQDTDGVEVTTTPHGGGPSTTWRAQYVVAADGAHSTVRTLLGVPFPGRSVLRSVVLADVRLTAGPPGRGLTLATTPDLFAFLVSYDRPDDRGGAWYRSMTWDRRHQVPDDVPVETAEVADVLGRATGRDLGLQEVGWHSRFHSDERQVASYRHGRVFLVGDAAHVHSPVGGQGMNTGIQDAVNLAWKLAAVLAGADERLLDSYQAERHPVGRRVVRQSGAMLRLVVLRPRWARALRDLVVPRLLRRWPLEGLVAGSFTGVGLRYGRRGPVGTRASRVPLAEGRLEVLQRDVDWVLVREQDAEPVDTAVAQARRTDAGPALLVRPDGYVAWAGRSTDHGWRQLLAGRGEMARSGHVRAT